MSFSDGGLVIEHVPRIPAILGQLLVNPCKTCCARGQRLADQNKRCLTGTCLERKCKCPKAALVVCWASIFRKLVCKRTCNLLMENSDRSKTSIELLALLHTQTPAYSHMGCCRGLK